MRRFDQASLACVETLKVVNWEHRLGYAPRCGRSMLGELLGVTMCSSLST